MMGKIRHEVTVKSHPDYYVTNNQEFLGQYENEKEAMDILEDFPGAVVLVVFKSIRRLGNKTEAQE